ncbi:MAG: hypothetical protein IPH64_03860 [Comamonadaceae bacterium]|nr:hypothetical protein [Comamonadaceae bacterium]
MSRSQREPQTHLVLIPGLAAGCPHVGHQLAGLAGPARPRPRPPRTRPAAITAMAQAVLEQFDGELLRVGGLHGRYGCDGGHTPRASRG